MPINTPAPAFIDLHQSTLFGTLTLDHHQILAVNPAVLSGATSTLLLKNGTTQQWDTALNALIALLRPLFTTNTTFVAAELWSQPTPTSDPIFIASTLIGLAGTVAAGAVFAGQAVFNFKGTDDSDMRFTLLESAIGVDLRQAFPALTAARQALVTYATGGTSFLYTRGNAYLANFGLMTTKTNDKIRKRRLGL